METIEMKITGVTYRTIGSLQNLPSVEIVAFEDESNNENENHLTEESFFNALIKASAPISGPSEKGKKRTSE